MLMFVPFSFRASEIFFSLSLKLANLATIVHLSFFYYFILLEKYKAIWAKIEDLKKIKLNALPVYDDRYIKTKIITFGYKVWTNFRGLIVPEDVIECKSFTVISIDSLLVYDSYISWWKSFLKN